MLLDDIPVFERAGCVGMYCVVGGMQGIVVGRVGVDSWHVVFFGDTVCRLVSSREVELVEDVAPAFSVSGGPVGLVREWAVIFDPCDDFPDGMSLFGDVGEMVAFYNRVGGLGLRPRMAVRWVSLWESAAGSVGVNPVGNPGGGSSAPVSSVKRSGSSSARHSLSGGGRSVAELVSGSSRASVRSGSSRHRRVEPRQKPVSAAPSVAGTSQPPMVRGPEDNPMLPSLVKYVPRGGSASPIFDQLKEKLGFPGL